MAKIIIPTFLEDADNVYRTKNYIVKQVMEIQENTVEDNLVISYDTYYRRTPARDLSYNLLYMNKAHPDGKRLPSTLYTRTYID